MIQTFKLEYLRAYGTDIACMRNTTFRGLASGAYLFLSACCDATMELPPDRMSTDVRVHDDNSTAVASPLVQRFAESKCIVHVPVNAWTVVLDCPSFRPSVLHSFLPSQREVDMLLTESSVGGFRPQSTVVQFCTKATGGDLARRTWFDTTRSGYQDAGWIHEQICNTRQCASMKMHSVSIQLIFGALEGTRLNVPHCIPTVEAGTGLDATVRPRCKMVLQDGMSPRNHVTSVGPFHAMKAAARMWSAPGVHHLAVTSMASVNPIACSGIVTCQSAGDSCGLSKFIPSSIGRLSARYVLEGCFGVSPSYGAHLADRWEEHRPRIDTANMGRPLAATFALLGLALGVGAITGSRTACLSFSPSSLASASFSNATHYATNTRVNISNAYSSIDVSNLPGFCRVELVITTDATAGSTALTEVWLPDDWNGRVLTVGNGGLAGGGGSPIVHRSNTLDLLQSLSPSRSNVAGISTNTGHDGGTDDGDWAGPHNDNAIVDWGWRALHLSVIAGKEIVQQYYGQPAGKSYYLGCSTGRRAYVFVFTVLVSPSHHVLGGRQGLKEVQDFPDDFDGVVVGSPANWQTHVQAWSVHMNLNTEPSTSQHFMTEDMWSDVIAPEVMRQCDELDGLKDGIINDPRICSFRPETLTCRPGQNTSTCLMKDQISALHRIYADYYEADQTYVFGGYYPGGETEYYHGLVGKKHFVIGTNYFGFMVTNDTGFTIHDYNATVLKLADKIDPGQANAINPNLTAFAGPTHNGKLIQYVGWADQLISPGNSIHYYETVHEFTLANTTMDIDDYYRLFLVPGMNHCHGGFAANAFGSVEQASNDNPPISFDPQHNILAAIVQWVEDGVAPDTITAANYNDNDVANGLGFTRPLCRVRTHLIRASNE
ncbi:hypothetical protein NUW54_g3142 [Trametes sanguinea]|uniref:Uncharacterized protein n=1 Tax=Trametes sanguinea TaxID=158606 RepID=A0ACC1Q4D8_9APHY|nr:hypothetical protein NUW54_g3142 [Trametes sanguinea]